MRSPGRLGRARLAALAALAGCRVEEIPDAAGAESCAPGAVCTWMGVPGFAGLAAGEEARPRTDEMLYMVQDLEFAPDGTAFVADFNNHRVVRVEPDGTARSVSGHGIPGDGSPGGCAAGCSASLADMWHPSDIVLDPSDPDVLLVVAWQNHRLLRIDTAADEVRWLAGTGEEGYGADPVAFSFPSSVVLGAEGEMYVADQANQLVRRLDPDGSVEDFVGTPGVFGYTGDGGPASSALLHGHSGWEGGPSSKLALHDRRLFLADTINGTIRAVDLDTGRIERVAGRFVPSEAPGSVPGYSGDDGPALDAVFWRPRDVEIAPDGTMYVADTGNHCIRAVTPDGLVETVAGRCGEPGYAGDGGPATEALFDTPCGVALDRAGDLYVADSNNHLIRRVRLGGAGE